MYALLTDLVTAIHFVYVATVIFGILYLIYVYDFIPYEFLSRISTPPRR